MLALGNISKKCVLKKICSSVYYTLKSKNEQYAY